MPRRGPILMAFLLALLTSGHGRAGDRSTAFRQLAAGRVGAVLSELAEMGFERARLLAGQAWLRQGRVARAERAFTEVLTRTRPDSRFRAKALFGLAECLARRGSFAAAESKFAQGLEWILSAGRKAVLARRLAELADEKLNPPGEQPADPQAAEQLLRAALPLAGVGELAEQIDLALATALVRQDRRAEAGQWLEGFPDRHPGSPRRHQARYQAAEHLLAANQRMRARRLLDQLLTEHLPAAVHERALLALARSHGFPAPGNGQELHTGLAVLEEFLRRFPDSRRVSRVRLEMAQAALSAQQPALAGRLLSSYLAHPPPGADLPEARFRLAEALQAQSRLPEAREAYAAFARDYPNHQHWLEARGRVTEIDWLLADRALLFKQYRRAGELLARFASDYPAEQRAPLALLKAAGCRQEVGDRAGAETLLERLVTRHHEAEQACEAWYQLGLLAEQREDFTAASHRYRQAADCDPDGLARARLLALDRPALHLAATQVARSGQPPRLEVQVRNIAKLQVRLYPVETEEFFRDRLDMDGVTELDIALCQPASQLEVAIAGFQPRRLVKQDITLPVKKPGTYLVHVSGGGLEATTAVRLSDLDILARQSGRQLFVLSENMRHVRPWPGVRLLVTDGESIVASGRTGPDGTWQLAIGPETEGRQLRVLALRDGHVAWSTTASVKHREPLRHQARALLVPDRPAYRPGESIQVAGLVRDRQAADGTLTFHPGDDYTLELSDGQGLVLERRVVSLDEYGSVAATFQLDPQSPPGNYPLRLLRGEVQLTTARVTVGPLALPPYRLRIELEHRVVTHGEAVAGVVVVRHPSSRAVADQLVQIGWRGSGAWQEARSDEHGRVRFQLPTRELERQGRLTLVARLPRHGLEARAPVVVAERDFEIELRAPDSWRAGQTADVELRLVGADGRRRHGRVEFEVLHRVVEGELATHSRRTVEVGESGLRLPLTLDAPGVYLLRALANDSRGNPVYGEKTLTVLEQPQSPLLLGVAQARLAPGQALEATITSQLDRALALLTMETDWVVQHRVVRLHRGANRVSLAVPPALDRFRLQLSALHGTEHSNANRLIEIEQNIELTLRSDRRRYRPGQEVELTVLARDSAGRPVDANVVLAVVDSQLFTVFPEQVPGLLDTFVVRQPLHPFTLHCSNAQQFPAVTGVAPAEPVVTEAEGSAAMVALSHKRRAMTEKAVHRFAQLAKIEGRVGGMVGQGAGAGGLGMAGYGRGGGASAIRMGQARVAGRELSRHFLALTAAFYPSLRTGPDGVATVRFRLPHNVTSWRVAARALGRRAGAGERTTELRVSAPLWAELIAPAQLVAGDRWQPGVRLFNNRRRREQVRLELEVGGRRHTRTVTLGPLGQAEELFPAQEVAVPAAGAELTVKITAQSDSYRDELVRALPVRPQGFRERLVQTGVLSGNRSLEVVVPPQWQDVQVRLWIDPRRQGLSFIERLETLPFADQAERALLAWHLWQATGTATPPVQRRLLAARLRQAVVALSRALEPDASPRLAAATDTTLFNARAVRALAWVRRCAADIGWSFPAQKLEDAQQRLLQDLQRLRLDAHTRRAELLYSLAVAAPRQLPELALGRLERLRRQLPLAAQAWLGLTWHQLGRPEKAAEMARLVAARLADPEAAVAGGDRLRGWQLLAAVAPSRWNGSAWEQLLVAAATPWAAPEDLTALAAVLAARLQRSKELPGGELQLRWDERPLARLALAKASAGARPVTIPPSALTVGSHRLELRSPNRLALPYRLEVSGFRAAPPAAADSPLRLERLVEPVPRPYRGREIRAGFSVVEPGSRHWTRPVDRLPAGRELEVTVTVSRRAGVRTGALLLEETVPAGTHVVVDSLRTQSIFWQLRGNRLRMLLPPASGTSRVTYRLLADTPGTFRFQPAQLLSFRRPEYRAYLAGSGFVVDPPEAPPPPVRATPDERYQRGRAARELRDWAPVVDELEPLLQEVPLREEVIRQVLDALLAAAIALGDDERMVRYFEMAKERNPELVVAFEKIPRLQQAYRRLESYEAGLRLARGLAEATLLDELHLVGVLEAVDEPAEALRLLREQLESFPDSPSLAEALYAFSQVLYARADESRQDPAPGFDRRGLLEQVVALQSRFAGSYPRHNGFPAAVYSLAAALLELDRPGEAAAWCDTALQLAPANQLAEELTYLRAFATFRQGDHDRALELCRQVERRAEDPAARQMAAYLRAQIYHARGQLEQALPLYQKVSSRFRDAAEALAELRRRLLASDQVTTTRRARPQLKLRTRNLEAVDWRVFSIDPLRLLRTKQHLADMDQVNLSGIPAVVSGRLRLGQPSQAEQDAWLRLPLRRRGAYLVMLRAADQVASSLVLVEGLRIRRVPALEGGRLRLRVFRADGRPAAGARMLVRNYAADELVGGHADLRGVFVTDQVSGKIAAVAELDGAYGMLLPAAAGAESAAEKPETETHTYEFEDDEVKGLLSPLPDSGKKSNRARGFFQQEVKGVSAEQVR